MTTPNQSSQDPTLSDEHGQQCMLYLLGELDAKQSAAFERQLHSSPELGAELLRQADVIHALSQTPLQPTLAPVTSTIMRWPIVASIVPAVAACFAIMIWGVQARTLERDSIARLSPGSNAAVSEDLLIARAWADSHLDIDTSDDFAFSDSDGDDAIAVAADESSDIDSALSWMFIAFSANIDSPSSEGTNDG